MHNHVSSVQKLAVVKAVHGFTAVCACMAVGWPSGPVQMHGII